MVKIRNGNSRFYYCCICKKKLDKKPKRLNYQEHGLGSYGQYVTVASYDFCDRCIKVFNNWLIKHEAKSNQQLIAEDDSFCIDI